MIHKVIVIILFIVILPAISGKGQNIESNEISRKSSIKLTTEIVNQYVWRGSLSTPNPTPNIQPNLAFIYGGLDIGVWGSSDFSGNYMEFDPYLFWNVDHFKIGLTDYNWNLQKANYFNYSKNHTGHRIEGTIGFLGTRCFPVSIIWNTIFYGLDKMNAQTKQSYSTYVEIVYSQGPATFILGFTPWASYYNNYGVTAFDLQSPKKDFSIVNIGSSFTKFLKISKTFTLPVKATLSVNPSAAYSRNDFIHLILGIVF